MLPQKVTSPKATEPFSGSADDTVTFTKTVCGLYLSNDGSSDLTVEVNGETFTVSAGKEFREYFSPFQQIVITSAVAFHGYGLW